MLVDKRFDSETCLNELDIIVREWDEDDVLDFIISKGTQNNPKYEKEIFSRQNYLKREHEMV